jgi:hypothetical protein
MYVAASAEYDTLVTKRAPITARSSALSTENSRETRYTASDTHTSERTPESHGVPAPYLWRDYIAYLEKKQGDKICWVNFRDKQKFGWAAHHETFKFVNGGG